MTTVTTVITITSCPGKCPGGGSPTTTPTPTGVNTTSISTPLIVTDSTSEFPATFSPPPVGGTQTAASGPGQEEETSTPAGGVAQPSQTAPGSEGEEGGEGGEGSEITTPPVVVVVNATGITTTNGALQPSVQTAMGAGRQFDLIAVGLAVVLGAWAL